MKSLIKSILFDSVIFLVFIMGCDSSTSLLSISDEIANPDYINAKVNGVPYIFAKRYANNYFGIHVGADSGTTKLTLHLGYGDVGKYKWKGSVGFDDPGPHAILNYYDALKDSGGLTIVEHGKYVYIKGEFAFSFVNSLKETVQVSEGYFRLHYTSSD